MELQEQRDGTVDLVRASEIAEELGIDRAAFDAALLEHAGARSALTEVARSTHVWWHAGTAAIAGLGAGGLFGALSVTMRSDDVLTGGTLLAGSLALAVREALYRSGHKAQATIAGWWAGSAAGLVLGLGHLTTDVLWYAGLSWAGCAAVVATLPGLVRHAQSQPQSAATTTD